MEELDATDRRILDLLQVDASLSLADIAERVHLSTNACWNRIRRLESSGVIRQRVALLDAAKIGVGQTIFVLVRAAEHSEEWFENFSSIIKSMPAVVEFHRTSGEIDYIFKVQVPDAAHYDEIYKTLIRSARCAGISGVFSMEVLKQTTALPLPEAARGTEGR